MRRSSRERTDAIWQTVEQNPGIKPGDIARKLGIPRSSVTRVLPTREERDMLLREDPKGRLWPWGRQK